SAQLNAVPRYPHDCNTVDDVGQKLETRFRIRGLMCSTSKGIRFYDLDVSAALNIRRIAAGPGRPRELSSWLGRPAMPNPGRPCQERVLVRDRGLLRKWQRRHQRQRYPTPAAGGPTLLSDLMNYSSMTADRAHRMMTPSGQFKGSVAAMTAVMNSLVKKGKAKSRAPGAYAFRIVKLYAKAARARLGWSGEEAQLFIRMACGYGINAKSSELKAATLDKGHVADLIEEANTHRRLLGMKKQGSLQDTLLLAFRMCHAVHVCRWLERWQQPPTPPAPGQPKRGKRRRGIAETREFVFDPDTQIGVGIDPGVTQAVSAASGVWDPLSGQLMADQLRRWKLTKGQVKHASGLNNARRDTERWLAPIKPHLQHLAAASSAGTSLEANLKHITVTLATWDAVWEVYLDPKWARQRLRLYGAQDRALEQLFKKLEEDMAELSMKRHGRAEQLVVFFGAAGIGTGGGGGADAVLRACRKVVCRPRGTAQLRGRVVLVDEHRTTRVSSAVNGKQPCEEELDKLSATRPAGWKPPAGQVEPRLVRPAWSQQRDQPSLGPALPSQPSAASAPRLSRQLSPTKGKGKGKAAKAKPAPQPGRWLDRDCNAALNMQRIGESRWRPLELCYWPEQGKLPAKGKEYPGLGYKRLRDKLPKAQLQQQQPAEAQ
ncbi:hypothetical protein QJQ45_021311, partial [Haematococcus lacustris]